MPVAPSAVPIDARIDAAATPARPSTRPSAARERILRTADRLFYDEGIHAVGINRIVEESAVTRVTLYRHFPSKDDLVSAYLDGRAAYDREQVLGLIADHPGDPRRVLTLLATVLTDSNFAAMQRGCPFINSSAEFAVPHVVRTHALTHRAWVTERLRELLEQAGHRSAASAAQQLMMVRTGAVVSSALDDNPALNADFLVAWEQVIDAGMPG